METCLKAAFSKPMSNNVKVATMNKEAAWQMLDKPLRSILVFAAHEAEPPAADDDDDDSPTRRPSMPRQRGRMRRSGRSSGSSHMDWLPKPTEIIADQPYSTAFQLAALLIHKQLDADSWDEAWDGEETKLREVCMTKGVHPVWHTVAEKTTLLAQFLAFPKGKASKKSAKKSMDSEVFRIDPLDTQSLAAVLQLAMKAAADAETKVALQKVINQLSGGRPIQPDAHLMNLKGSMAFVSLHLSIHSGTSLGKATLKECTTANKDLTEALQDLQMLREGTVSDWAGILALSDDDALTLSRRRLAWSQAPASAEELSSKHLSEGLSLLSDVGITDSVDRLTWWQLKALHNEKKDKQAIEVLQGLSLDASSDVSELLPLIVSLGSQDADSWLMSHVDNLDDGSWYTMVISEGLSNEVRTAVAQRLCDQQGAFWEEAKSAIIELLMGALDLERLCLVFSEDEMLPLTHPYEALFVSHVTTAHQSVTIGEKLKQCRQQALQAIHGAEVPHVFSPVAEHLLLLLEGIYKETPEVVEVLNKTALKAYSPIKAALSQNGSGGVVSLTNINKMRNSLGELELSPLEHRLFEVILLTLTMNGFLQTYHIGLARPDDSASVDALITEEALPVRLIPSFSYLALDHDLGLPQFVDWYQQANPRSPWAPLARAALFASNGDELNSAREYSRAAELFTGVASKGTDGDTNGEDDDSVLALPITLYRKSLIHYAHAKQWDEAIALLNKVPALKAAITERFKLYLNVCHTALTDTDGATRLIRRFVQRKQAYEEEDVEGNIIQKTRTIYLEEELDLLRNYPYEKAHVLPPDPFLGRVTAASTRISKDNRRSRNQSEQQFRQAMMTSSPSMTEVYDIAKSAAEDGAFEGLMYLERAQNSTKFTITDRKRLAGVEQTLFSQYKESIPTSKRRFLHNLKLAPLVILDTNILVDALVEKVYEHMELVFGANLNTIGSNRFHDVLRHHASAKRLHLMIPDDVRGELKQFAKDNRISYRFRSAMIASDKLENALSESVLLGLVDEILVEFNTWSPTSEMLEQLPEESEELTEFLRKHDDVFADLTELKQARGPTYRTTMDNRHIYPETTDLDIYRLATHLATQPLPEIGAVLVATMDGDFTLLDRAIEEKFGFSVAKNHRTLKPWLKLKAN